MAQLTLKFTVVIQDQDQWTDEHKQALIDSNADPDTWAMSQLETALRVAAVEYTADPANADLYGMVEIS